MNLKSILAFETSKEAFTHEALTNEMMEKLTSYQQYLEQHFQLTTLPKGVIWTNDLLATTTFSKIPIPAFTREDFIYMSPQLEVWQSLLVSQLEGKEVDEIPAFYENFSEEHLFIILAHELTHHIDLFVDEFDDERHDSIWFEEGMCFYLPRKFCLSEAEFQKITDIEQSLVNCFIEEYGAHSLDEFGIASYKASISSIMFDYWRSYIKVKSLVEHADGNIQHIFSLYEEWHEKGRKIPLTKYFEESQK